MLCLVIPSLCVSLFGHLALPEALLRGRCLRGHADAGEGAEGVTYQQSFTTGDFRLSVKRTEVSVSRNIQRPIAPFVAMPGAPIVASYS